MHRQPALSDSRGNVCGLETIHFVARFSNQGQDLCAAMGCMVCG